jgi:NADPH:quinone reductase-like Zn-dependent oxidoreductase
VPEAWSQAAASSVPVPYISAYYILSRMLSLPEKPTLLLHGALASPTGQALARLCLYEYEATLLVTEGEKGDEKALEEVKDALGLNHQKCTFVKPQTLVQNICEALPDAGDGLIGWLID